MTTRDTSADEAAALHAARVDPAPLPVTLPGPDALAVAAALDNASGVLARCADTKLPRLRRDVVAAQATVENARRLLAAAQRQA